jgi:SHS2 domain-containing protein
MGGFELLAHTADVGIRARGATLEEAFEQATLGLAEVLGALRPDPSPPDGPPGRAPAPDAEAVAVEVGADDHGALLVDWLNEVLWQHELRGHARIAGVRVERVGGDRAAGTVGFSTTGSPADGTSVKAATYHRLRVAREDGGWLAEVYLDV